MCARKLQEVTCDHVASYGLEKRKEGSIIHQKLKGHNVACLVVQLFHNFEMPPIKIANVSKRSAKRNQVNSQGDAKFPSFLCVQVSVGNYLSGSEWICSRMMRLMAGSRQHQSWRILQLAWYVCIQLDFIPLAVTGSTNQLCLLGLRHFAVPLLFAIEIMWLNRRNKLSGYCTVTNPMLLFHSAIHGITWLRTSSKASSILLAIELEVHISTSLPVSFK